MRLPTIAASICLAVFVAPATTTKAADLDISQQRPSELDWQTSPEGVAFAALQGDRFRESYQAMVRLPSGIASPLHKKSATMFGVMIEGEMIHYGEGRDPEAVTPVGPGSFYVIPAGLPHISACVSAAPCVTYLYQDGPFDFLQVTR